MEQKRSASSAQRNNELAGQTLSMGTFNAGPDGALLSGDPADEGKITIVYDHGDTPPVISIQDAGSAVQTVMANGVAVAVVGRADGSSLTENDIFLVERFVACNG